MKPDLTASQVKALLIVASLPGPPLAGPYSDLLEKVAQDTTAVQELTRVKEQAKALMKEAADEGDRDAARLLYHAAVAAAFVHHGAAISGRPMRKQQRLYERFAEQWAGHALGRLFREAAARVAGE